MNEGGSYIREKDGSLTLVQRTEATKPAEAGDGEATGADGASAPVDTPPKINPKKRDD